ncbi:MAG TPA: prepilin-type N-terminal cleavage/methylation domain-containing protein [Usitatibacter sp.]|nr:prepilin-type N-terminal cleavage/methylation domain-containing protein [Usitatibacter sp.]
MNRQRGFTLIEVVVAFVLLAVVLTLAFEVFSAGLARAGQFEDRSQALMIAQSQIASAGVEQAMREGEAQGESADHRFQWSTRITRTDEGLKPGQPAPSAYILYRIDVLVTWQDSQGRPQGLPLSTLAIWNAPT